MNRTFGWIQDAGSFANLKRVIMSIIPNSALNIELKEYLIPRYVPVRYNRGALIAAIAGENLESVPYELLKGYGSRCQLTLEENIGLFGYSHKIAKDIVESGGRGNAACTGIAQLALDAQRRLPDGRNKPYQGDWSAECFIRWAVALGFIDYNPENDTCKVTCLGKQFAETEDMSSEEKEIIGEALISYPPACRVLELLSAQGRLTKFEIGRQLGFIGEAGFTTVSQSLFVGGISSAESAKEKAAIRGNFEGSSDKYARMIGGWLCYIGWAAKVRKKISANYLGMLHSAVIGQSFEITQKGAAIMNRIRGGSRHRRSVKRVFWSMLATAAQDADYLRSRRYCTLKAIMSSRKTIEQINDFLVSGGFDAGRAAIADDIRNFSSIGLCVDENSAGYIIKDSIVFLGLPPDAALVTKRADVTAVKDRLGDMLQNISHRYLDLLDLAYDGNHNKEFEAETMSLLTEELDFSGLHLGGPKRPDGIIFKDAEGVIIDMKAYSEGYNLPIAQADEMIRYIDENKRRGGINSNLWWDYFDSKVASFGFLYVSSEYIGHFKDNILYIRNRTSCDGSAINAKNLLILAEKLRSAEISYSDAFNLLRCNNEVVFDV